MFHRTFVDFEERSIRERVCILGWFFLTYEGEVLRASKKLWGWFLRGLLRRSCSFDSLMLNDFLRFWLWIFLMFLCFTYLWTVCETVNGKIERILTKRIQQNLIPNNHFLISHFDSIHYFSIFHIEMIYRVLKKHVSIFWVFEYEFIRF